MNKFAAPLTLALACIAYGLAVVCEFYFAAKAQGATNVCNTDCLLQKMDALNQKAQALEHSLPQGFRTTQFERDMNAQKLPNRSSRKAAA